MIGLAANTIGIGLVIKLHNQFSAQAAAVTSSFHAMHGGMNRVLNDNLRANRRLGIGMAATGIIATRGLMNAVNAAADFEFTMNTIAGVLEKTKEEIKPMGEIALKIGTESIYTADQVASAMEYMARSGFKMKDVYASIQAVVDLGAAAGGRNIGGKGGMADRLTAILHQFNLSAEMSSRVADVLSKAANISASDVEDIAHAMSYTGGTAHRLNIDLESTAAMLTVLSNAGLRGGIAGRSLNNMLTYLANAVGRFKSQRQTDAFEAIGLGLEDIIGKGGELKSINEILTAFGTNLRGLSSVEQVSALNALLNIRGSRAMMPLLEKSIKIGYNFEDAFKELMNNSTGYAGTISKKLMDGIRGDLMILSDTWKTFKIEIGTTLGIIVRPIAQGLAWIITKMIAFAKTPIGKPIIIFVAALSLALTVAGLFIVALTTIKLITLAQTVTAATMGKTMVWAWNSSAAAAMRYAAIAGAANAGGVLVGGRLRNAATGRFMSMGGSAVAGAAGAAAGAALGKQLVTLKSILQFFGRGLSYVGNIIKGFGGGLFLVIGILGAIVGFGNMIRMVIFWLGSFINALRFIGDYVSNLDEGPYDAYIIAKQKFAANQSRLHGSLGFTQDNINLTPEEKEARNKFKYSGFGEGKIPSAAEIRAASKTKQTVVMQIDGKKLGEVVIYSENQLAEQLLAASVKN